MYATATEQKRESLLRDMAAKEANTDAQGCGTLGESFDSVSAVIHVLADQRDHYLKKVAALNEQITLASQSKDVQKFLRLQNA